jgi:hypothetical protein
MPVLQAKDEAPDGERAAPSTVFNIPKSSGGT